jgi:hypothetical protein
MNDMPATQDGPDGPSLDGKAIADLAEQLNQLLRLRTFPIGMKLFEASWSPSLAWPASPWASRRRTCRRFQAAPV